MISRIGGTDKPLRSRFDIYQHSSSRRLLGGRGGSRGRVWTRTVSATQVATVDRAGNRVFSGRARATREVSLSFTVAAALFVAGGVKVGQFCPFDLREDIHCGFVFKGTAAHFQERSLQPGRLPWKAASTHIETDRWITN
jgi:hypothetical protein